MNLKSAISLLVSILITTGCNKIKNNEQKVFPTAGSTSCTNPQRYRDSILNTIKVTKNVLYRSSNDYKSTDAVKTSLYYDFYEPVETNSSIIRPLIILLHGGGFVSGTRNDMSFEADLFAKKGYCVASIDYRHDPNLTNVTTYNTVGSNVLYRAIYRAIQDTRFAIRQSKQLWANARLDTNFIFVGGVSAGAITALHTAYLNDNEVPTNLINTDELGKLDYAGNLNNSSTIKGVFAYAGALTGLDIIGGNDNIPTLNIMSKKDSYFPYLCGTDYLYNRIYVCGAKSISDRLVSLNITQNLILLDDTGFSANPPTHGTVFWDYPYRRRDVDSTAAFLYRTFYSTSCL